MADDHIIVLNNDNIEVNGAQVEHPSKIPDKLLEQLDNNMRNPKVANKMITNNSFILKNLVNTMENNDEPLDENELKSSFEVGDNMENQNFDTFFKELKDDMRERESRTREEINAREERFERSLDKYHQENKEREERIHQLITEIKDDTKDFKNEIKEDNKEFKSDMKQEFQNLKQDFQQTQEIISNLVKHNESIANTNKWSGIATIIGISAVVVASIVALIIS
ncbi:hypothetical protein ACTNEO_04970 [Gracilibacillus sp. HCP3S3_G5_1]|jgi:gas vesicle protein|uniref:hypothetical protein n=1 Tax=unclassified Gracilibacillus TaxID=2625209 RepID=UPI003F8AF4F1